MGNIQKNIPKVEQIETNVPVPLARRKKNFLAARYTYDFDKEENKYIKYNTLRMERPDQEVIDIAKIYRVKDRDTGDEWIVYYQTSKTRDYENNLVPCPVDECYGVVEKPQTNPIVNSQNQIVDLTPIETLNDFYIPFSKEKVVELLEKSRNSQNIVCYIGYCKPIRLSGNDFIEEKRTIKDQYQFMEKEMEDLMSKSQEHYKKKTYVKSINKKSNKKQEESPLELSQKNREINQKELDKEKMWESTNKEPKKSLKEIQEEKEHQEQVHTEQQPKNITTKGKLKIKSNDTSDDDNDDNYNNEKFDGM